MKKIINLVQVILLLVVLMACTNQSPKVIDGPEDFDTIEEKVEWWIANLTLDEKAGQMIQAERINNNNGISVDDARRLNIGSVLNGGGNVPATNNVPSWYLMYQSYYQASITSSSGIPLIYGVDAVHGHGNLQNATIFPHNIGLAAANNPELMRAIGEVTAYEIAQTGLTYNFSPSLGIIKDKRWGRTYETFGENPAVPMNLIGPYIEGLQTYGIAASAKHFVGDGYTTYGTGLGGKLDRGNATITLDDLENIHLPLYREAIEAGVKTIMVSYSSLNGLQMHENAHMITDVLKGEMGFKGFVISDYNGIDNIAENGFEQKVAAAINAGIDMLMQPHNFEDTIAAIKIGVQTGDIPMARIDDAVSRILTVKYELGLFETKERLAADLRNAESLAVARQAVRESLVLLKNEQNVLPLSKDMDLLVVGQGSNNIGIQSGGWTMTWQGSDNLNIAGTSILKAFRESTSGQIYTNMADVDKADAIVLVISERPHAEMMGDSVGLSLIDDTGYPQNLTWINQVKNTGKPVIAIMLSSKPLLVTDYIDGFDAFVMAFLPGTEGAGITDVLYGDYNFVGKLPYTYPLNASQAADTMLNPNYNPEDYLFPYGYGLTYSN
ncbi:glycoside hydrolase family 3 protein [Paracholeplasma manati]|uniref:beta-glucosidase n=1 Tax=Paracholeplasma manati TaxID=591373 RepID=A0ABT2Y7Q9_9MOLU|nr:glycoside hydrolase family 3 protein [Paracholeplasma manati]MCV2232776.1 glycoside hydrolase family 3 protein [Paracholeplasma manati]MDG0887916.1 glycoside hydrolase family 3 protein [Paracholeplasma manati]